MPSKKYFKERDRQVKALICESLALDKKEVEGFCIDELSFGSLGYDAA